jgi:beta-galactosidase
VLATFGSDFYAGGPALTKHGFGNGQAYYIASDPDENFLTAFYAGLATQHGLAPRFKTGANVEVTMRVKNGQPIIFVLNHNAQPVTVTLDGTSYRNLLNDASVQGTLALKGYDVAILVES